MEVFHKSVLLDESIGSLNIQKGFVVVDATLGGGGHSNKILELIGDEGKLIVIDQDRRAIENFRKQVGEKQKNVFLAENNFSQLEIVLQNLKINAVDAILADLGYSSMQLEDKETGMSFLLDAPLDMRLKRDGLLTAKIIVNEYDETDLYRVLQDYGEEEFSGRICKKIIENRKIKQIESTVELVRIIRQAVPQRYCYGKIHPATKTFQALRIEVNRELDVLKEFIPQAVGALRAGGRLAIITFHSLEDRIVKNMFKELAGGCVCSVELRLQEMQNAYIRAVENESLEKIELEKELRSGVPDHFGCQCGKTKQVKVLTKKPIIPQGQEVRRNPRARSAKLRVCEKLNVLKNKNK